MPQTPLVEQSIVLQPVAADHPDAQAMMEELNQRLEQLSGDSGAAGFQIMDMVPGRSIFLLARDEHGQPVGCGAVRPLAAAGAAPVAELKRMYARDGRRGVGAALLARLEHAAQQMGYRALWLETRRINTRALRFYQRHGYREIPNFGSHVGRAEAVCLGKTLPAPA